MKLVDEVVIKALSSMSVEERRELVLTVVDRLLSQMSGAERQTLMEHVVDHFLDTLPNEERSRVVRELVPRLLSQLMQSGDMTVDQFISSVVSSLPNMIGTPTPGESTARD